MLARQSGQQLNSGDILDSASRHIRPDQ